MSCHERLTGKTHCIAWAVLLLCCTCTATAADQEAAEPVRLTEIVVTAQKIPESVADVPVSVTVVPSDEVRDADLTDLGQVAGLTPNFFFDASGFRRAAFHSLRGITSNNITGAPAFGLYVDDVPQLRLLSFNTELFDVERIETLRGPQGTLYGRDAIGGVVNVVTREPQAVLGGDGESSFGNYDLREARVAGTGPVASDRVLLSLAGAYLDRDGYTVNDIDGDDVDSRNDLAGRAKLTLLATDDLDVRAAAWGERDRDGGTQWDSLERARTRPYHVERDVDGDSDRDLYGTSLRLVYEGLPFTVTSISAYQNTRVDILDDIIDLSAAPLGAGQIDENQEQVTQEIRASSPPDVGPWRWIGGAFYFYERYRNDSSYLFFPAAQMPSLFRSQLEHDQGFAFFGQATYTLWNRLDLTLGLRLAAEWQEVDLDQSVAGLTAGRGDREDYLEPLPRAAAAYHWLEAQMTYASVTRGFRAGGFNVLFDDPDDFSFGPEFAWTYEVGHKGRWYDERVGLDVAVFYTDYTDQQIQQLNAQLVRYSITNTGTSRIVGTEVETHVRPLRELDLWGGVGYQDGRFDDYENPGLGADYAGNHIPFAPLYTFNVGTQYRRPLAGPVTLFARLDLLGTGPMYLNASNDVRLDSYALVNLRAGVEWRGMGIYGFAANLFDDDFLVFGLAENGQKTGYAQPGDPRTFGVTLRAAL